jgi:L-cysteine/cystine lyase
VSHALREQFPVLARLAFLNTGTNGPVPASAPAAAAAEVERQTHAGRGPDSYPHRLELQSRQRQAYAARLGADADDVALTTSTSEGIARALAGLGLGRGDEVVTSDEEHPGVLGPLQAARDLAGVSVREVPLARVAEAIGPRTRAVVCSHVSWVSGAVAPPELAEVEVPAVLDGAQGVGAIPVDVRALGCDVYAGSGQKWLCGPDASGMLYVSPSMRERLAVTAPSYVSYVDAGLGLDAQLLSDARRYDAPTLAAETSAFALAALDTLGAAGWDAVYERASALASQLAERLRARGHEVRDRGPTTLVSWHCPDAEAVRDRLADAGVVVRNLPGRDLLRASVGAWNDDSDLERLLAGIDSPR